MWASSNLGADAFLLVYDITSRDSLDALQYFDDLIDMETETRLDNAERARKMGGSPSLGSGGKITTPIKLVAGNKCDLAENRQVPAAVGLDWARKRGCGFMETSARLEVNIEETFALIVRRVMEARKIAEMDMTARPGISRNMTAPLSPLPPGMMDEKRGPGVRGPNLRGEKVGRGHGGFWKRLRCW